LENEGVGARSGTRLVTGSARSQNQRKVRCSRSSRKAVASRSRTTVLRGAAGGGGSVCAAGEPAAKRRTAPARNRRVKKARRNGRGAASIPPPVAPTRVRACTPLTCRFYLE